jgi:hypothetical protein
MEYFSLYRSGDSAVGKLLKEILTTPDSQLSVGQATRFYLFLFLVQLFSSLLLRLISMNEEISKSEWIRRAIREKLERHRIPQP